MDSIADPSVTPSLEGGIFVALQVQGCGSCKRMLAAEEFCPSHRGRKGFWCHDCARKGRPIRVEHPPRQCGWCGERFTPKQSNAVYCGRKCKDKAKCDQWAKDLAASKPKRACSAPDCDADITHMRSDAKYCSDPCSQRGRMTPERRRKYRLAQKYGITPEDYDQMVIDQGDKCFLCDAKEPGTKHGFWHIDHCHDSGKLRKLLCSTCNTGLGSFYDNPEVLRRAADYIEAHRD